MEQIANILLTFFNVLLTYFNFNTSRKKDFEDKLYMLKLEIYQDLSIKLQKHILRLDINKEPFNQLYEIKDDNKWIEYINSNTNEIMTDIINIQNEIYKHFHILPQIVVKEYFELTELFMGFIVQGYHKNSEILIDAQEKVWDKYYLFLNILRKDLKIEEIDKSLSYRISSTKIK